MYHNNAKHPKKPLKYIQPPQHNQSCHENIQKYNNLIMHMPTSDKNEKNVNAFGGQNSINSIKNQTKHCRSLVDLNNSEVSSLVGNEYDDYKQHKERSADQYSNYESTKPQKPLKYLQHHYSSVSIEPIQKSDKYQSYRNTKPNTKLLQNSSSSIQSITKKYFGTKVNQPTINSKSSKNMINKFNTLTSFRKNNRYTCGSLEKQSHEERGDRDQIVFCKPQKYVYNIESDEKSPKRCSPEQNNYNLLLKLKNYIEQLKNTEEGHLKQISLLEEKLHSQNKLMEENKDLQSRYLQKQEQNQFLKDQLQVMRIRENQLLRKIKSIKNTKQQKQIFPQKKHHHQKSICKNCHDHQLIIQSLKNVINEQLAKIIELEKYKVIGEQNRRMHQRYSEQKSSQMSSIDIDNAESNQLEFDDEGIEEGDQYDINAIELSQVGNMNQIVGDISIRESDKKKNTREMEIYSFKKHQRNCSLTSAVDYGQQPQNKQASIEPYTNRIQPYPEETSQQASRNTSQRPSLQNITNKTSQYQSGESNLDSLQNIPEPYYNILANMRDNKKFAKNKSEMRKKMTNLNLQIIEDSDGFSERMDSRRINESGQNSVGSERSDYSKMSEDRILAEVGNYLQSIKRNKKGHPYNSISRGNAESNMKTSARDKN